MSIVKLGLFIAAKIPESQIHVEVWPLALCPSYKCQNFFEIATQLVVAEIRSPTLERKIHLTNRRMQKRIGDGFAIDERAIRCQRQRSIELARDTDHLCKLRVGRWFAHNVKREFVSKRHNVRENFSEHVRRHDLFAALNFGAEIALQIADVADFDINAGKFSRLQGRLHIIASAVFGQKNAHRQLPVGEEAKRSALYFKYYMLKNLLSADRNLLNVFPEPRKHRVEIDRF